MWARILAGYLLSPMAAPAAAQTPDYIRANRDAALAAFGPDVTARIFSDQFTALRRDMVLRSLRNVPGHACGPDPAMALAFVVPFPTNPGTVSWIERYTVDCRPRTQRNFLALVENGNARMIELLPGGTQADPRLQRDAMTGASAAAATIRARDCERQWVTDTQVTTPIRGRNPWVERWVYDLCGTRAELEMTFTPTDRGTSWSVKRLK
jgi:hypothetical protein